MRGAYVGLNEDGFQVSPDVECKRFLLLEPFQAD